MSQIHRRGQQYERSEIADYINPDNGYRGKMKRLGKDCKDFAKENRMEIRAIQDKNRDDKEEKLRSQKELYKMPKFRNVESRLFDSRADESDEQPVNTNFLTRNEGLRRMDQLKEAKQQEVSDFKSKMNEERGDISSKESPRRPSVPKANEIIKLQRRNSSSDFIQKNRVNAVMMEPKNKPIDKSENSKHESYGRVPEYLERRKAEKESEENELRRNASDPDCPPGMCVMSERERLETLEILHRNKTDTMLQFNQLPFNIETPSMRRKQQTLDAKLKEIERAIELFSKPKVYVALDR